MSGQALAKLLLKMQSRVNMVQKYLKMGDPYRLLKEISNIEV
jgi:hypothetical protein